MQFCSLVNIKIYFTGTALLTTFISAIIDKRNGIPNYLHSILFGITLITIGTSLGMNLGYPINPARDLGNAYNLTKNWRHKTFDIIFFVAL